MAKEIKEVKVDEEKGVVTAIQTEAVTDKKEIKKTAAKWGKRLLLGGAVVLAYLIGGHNGKKKSGSSAPAPTPVETDDFIID